jgi:transcription initiation factor TFIID TATA-box-binding protein
MFEPELVNIVGGAKLDQELRLETLCEDIEGEEVRYDPEQWAGLYIRFEKKQPAILVFSSGKYNIAGADSKNQILGTNDRFITRLSELGITIGDPSFEIRNRVYMDQFDKKFDLNALTIGLGMENTEYEPEQFPGIFYDNPDVEGVFLIFRTGKVILTGVKTKDQAARSFKFLHEQISKLLS